MEKTRDKIADAVHYCLVSLNCPDSNSEPANVVDGLYRIADALFEVARAIRRHGKTNRAGNQTHKDIMSEAVVGDKIGTPLCSPTTAEQAKDSGKQGEHERTQRKRFA